MDTVKNKVRILANFNRNLMNKRMSGSTVSGNLQALIH
jgi:hypothetical protein